MATPSHRATAEDVDAFLARHGYAYVDETDSNLDCPICRSPFVDPVMAPHCGHVFCRACLARHTDGSSTCPVDRQALDTSALRPAPHLIHAMVDELAVRCPHTPHGCTFTSQRHLLRAHLLTSCLFVETSCPCSRDCDLVVLKKDLPAHVDACDYATVACPMACGAHVRRAELEKHAEHLCPRTEVECAHRCGRAALARAELADHYANECPKAPLDCPHRRFGCPWRGTRRILHDEHLLAECAYDGIKPYLEATEARLHRSEAENTELKERMTKMEERQERTLAELKALRTSLGDYAPPRPLRSAYIEALPEASTSSATLPGKLTEIDDAVTGLAKALEALEVRHEVTVMHETVRLQDEVQALRAAVHGVRLQTYWLMMECERRNSEEAGNVEGAAGGPPNPMDWRSRMLANMSSPAALFAGMPPPPMGPPGMSPPGPQLNPFVRRPSDRQDTKL